MTGGKKTEAGRNRIVPVHRRVQHILDTKLAMGGETIICNEEGEPYKPDSFRRRFYFPALEKMDTTADAPCNAPYLCYTPICGWCQGGGHSGSGRA